MQASPPGWTEGPADAPYDDDYAESRMSFVHELPRASRRGVLLMLTVLSLLTGAFAMAGRASQAPLTGSGTATGPATSLPVNAQPTALRPASDDAAARH
jgi:hypothetical protein